jgi:hypothetical protein
MGKLLQTLDSLQTQDGHPDVEGRRIEYVMTFPFVLPDLVNRKLSHNNASCAKQR